MTDKYLFNKERMVANFCRASDSYEQAAWAQKRAADQLVDIIKLHIRDYKKLVPFLEIGAGTGVLTEKLLQLGISRGTISDIAPGMVDVLCRQFSAFSGIDVQRIDGESFSLPVRYQAVFSASTFQWFHDLAGAFAMVRRHLNDSGLFAFTMFVDGTLRELHQAAEMGSIIFPGHKMHHPGNVLDTLKSEHFELLFSRTLDIVEYHENAFACLHSIKRTGATNASTMPMQPSALKKLVSIYNEHFFEARGVPLTFTALFVLAKAR